VLDKVIKIESSDLVLAVPVLKTVISSDGPQAVCGSADGPRASFHIMLTPDTAVIGQHCRFDR